MFMISKLYVLGVVAVFVGCGGDKVGTTDISVTDVAEAQDLVEPEDIAAEDVLVPVEVADGSGEDTVPAEDVVAPFDTTPDAVGDVVETFEGFACDCATDEVFRWGSCVPTLMLGCGPACDETSPCDDGLMCDDCAASSACGVRDCRSACVVPVAPHALVPDPLRLTPTSVPSAGGTVTISGTSFYIGALGHRVRVGDVVLGFGGGSECELAAEIPAGLADGTHVVEVSQYSGEGPWVVAGFIFKGQAAPVCVQPGMPCGSSGECCGTDALTLTCDAGRCRMPAEGQ